jgi:hypothetical protein
MPASIISPSHRNKSISYGSTNVKEKMLKETVLKLCSTDA